MTTLVIGHKGNMGRRYTAVLDHLKSPWVGVDLGDDMPAAGTFTSVIVATPTHTHVKLIRSLFPYGVPILCEKPVCKDLDQLEGLVNDCRKLGVTLTMVNQYAHIYGPKFIPDNRTYYNYFKSGGDGLAWDCINVLGLATGHVDLGNTSPVWRCAINGRPLSIDKMDPAYIDMISTWLARPVENLDYILKAHKKASEYERRLHTDSDRHPSPFNQRKTA